MVETWYFYTVFKPNRYFKYLKGYRLK